MKYFVFVSLFLLTACATQNFNQSKGLAAGQGLVAFTYDCTTVIGMAFYPKGTEFQNDILNPITFKSAANVGCVQERDGGIKLVEMSEGDYFLGSVQGLAAAQTGGLGVNKSHIPEREAYKFHVTAGAVTYIGNLVDKSYVNSGYSSATVYYNFAFINNYGDFIKKASPENKKIINSYKLIKAPAKI